MAKNNVTPDVASIVAAVMAQMSGNGGGSANATVAPTAIVERVSKPRTAKPSTPATNPAAFTLKPGSYKGHPIVAFESNTARPFALGYSKLRVILAHADALRKIVG